MIQVQKINNIEVKPVIKTKQEKPYDYQEYFDRPYPVIYFSAKTNSGKTTVISHLMDVMPTKDTVVRIYSTTYKIDKTMQQLIKNLEKKNITVECFDSLKLPDGDTCAVKSGYRDVLDKQLNELILFVEKNRKEIESKQKQFPLVISIFDDFNMNLKYQKSMVDLCTKGRHFYMPIIYSSQKYNLLDVLAREQIAYLFLFKNLKLQTLEQIYDEQITNMTFDNFLDLYEYATSEPYQFFNINKNDQTDIKMGFNKKLSIVNQ